MPHFADTYTAKGAERLRSIITKYWLAHGFTNVRVEKYEVWDGTWGIRSNLVNGLPPTGRGGYGPKKRVLSPRIETVGVG